MDEFVCVIMAGGAGTRFWPLSNEKRPKQFLKLVADTSLLQESYKRARTLCPAERILVFTAVDYLPLVEEQLPELPPANIFGEPCRRDTAAAVAWASLVCQKRFGDSVIVTLTADHWIQPLEAFQEALGEFVWGAARSQGIYTMGITPTWPATGYGYLELGPTVHEERHVPHYQVRRFKEKPDLATAQKYMKSGSFLWNSGMFAWKSQTILSQLNSNLPRHLEILDPVCEMKGAEFERAFESLQRISIDFAVLEKAPEVLCVRPRFQWSDLGGWLALEPFLEASEDDNVARGRLNVLESQGNLVFCADEEEQVALIGVSDLVVVRVEGKTLIFPRSRGEDIKKLLDRHPELNKS